MSISAITLAILWKVRVLVDLIMIKQDDSALTTTIYVLLVFFLLQSLLSIGQSYIPTIESAVTIKAVTVHGIFPPI